MANRNVVLYMYILYYLYIPFCNVSWPTGRAIDPAPRACLITKFISFAHAVPGSVWPYSAESRPKIPIISFFVIYLSHIVL